MTETTNNYKLIGFLEALTLIFVIAKIFGYVTWSWWQVFAPIILQVAAAIVILILVILACVIKAVFD